MTVPAKTRRFVRQRADYSCEYCGVSETDVGAELTIDHHRPQAQGGTHDPANLIYCCPRCNQYKAAYWPSSPTDPVLWNPRQESAEVHFLLSNEGRLTSLTSTGAFTLRRMRLNRPALVAHRVRRIQQEEQSRQQERQARLLESLRGILGQQETLLHEQQTLLRKQQRLLILLNDTNASNE